MCFHKIFSILKNFSIFFHFLLQITHWDMYPLKKQKEKYTKKKKMRRCSATFLMSTTNKYSAIWSHLRYDYVFTIYLNISMGVCMCVLEHVFRFLCLFAWLQKYTRVCYTVCVFIFFFTDPTFHFWRFVSLTSTQICFYVLLLHMYVCMCVRLY